MAYCLVSNVIYSFSEKNIDGASHLGGFIYGILIGLLLTKEMITIKNKKITSILVYITLAICTGLIIAFTVL